MLLAASVSLLLAQQKPTATKVAPHVVSSCSIDTAKLNRIETMQSEIVARLGKRDTLQ